MAKEVERVASNNPACPTFLVTCGSISNFPEGPNTGSMKPSTSSPHWKKIEFEIQLLTHNLGYEEGGSNGH
jgi:hypothetical protein